MRVVCISDTHGLHDALQRIPDGDVLVHAGDFTDTGDRDEVRLLSYSRPHSQGSCAFRYGCVADGLPCACTVCGYVQVLAFNEFLGKLPHKYKLVVAGNHESTFDRAFYPFNWQQYGHRQQYGAYAFNSVFVC